MSTLKLSAAGVLSINGVGASVLTLDFSTFSFLSDTELEIAFFSKISAPLLLSDLIMRLRIVDATTGDEVIKIQGIVDSDPENMASIVAVADATEEFEQFELSLGVGAFNAILDCDPLTP